MSPGERRETDGARAVAPGPQPTRRRVAALLAGGLVAAPWLRPARAAAAPRIASLDWGAAETLAAMGVPPIAVSAKQGYGEWVVEPALGPEVVDLGSRFTPNIELLAAMAPDLIVTIPYLAALDPIVARVAPLLTFSLYTEDGRPFERAQAMAVDLAAAAGRPPAGPALVAAGDAALERHRRRLTPLKHRSVLVLSLLDARHAWVYGAKSMFKDVLDRLDLTCAWTGVTTDWGFSAVGLEDLAETDPDAHLVVLEPLPEDVAARLADNPLWRRMPATRRGDGTSRLSVVSFGALPSALRFADLLTARLTQGAA